MVAGSAHPMEHALYDAFVAGWNMRDTQGKKNETT